jgi:nucleoside-diphosphate-sugar epimerase
VDKNSKIILPGAAGLVGQNLIIELKEQGFSNLVVIDKFIENVKILKSLHPDIEVITADVSQPGEWQSSFKNGDVVVMLQAQIGSKDSNDFIRNNIDSAKQVMQCTKKYNIPYVVHISSSVVVSVADDDYTNTKKEQEKIVAASGIKHCMLRPTLMFGWFDRKHLGWLSRFMQRIPVFPVPGLGKIIRQPLYVRDFCRIIVSAMQMQPENKIYDITGTERIYYVDIIKAIRKTIKAKTLIIPIPYLVFWMLLKIYGLFSKNPPFTPEQLDALMAADEFEVIPWDNIFSVKATNFNNAIEETYHNETYSNIVLKF